MADDVESLAYKTELSRQKALASAPPTLLDPAGDYGMGQKMLSAAAMTIQDTGGAIVAGMTANALDAVDQIAGNQMLTKEGYDALVSRGIQLPEWHENMSISGADLVARVNRDREFQSHVLSRSVNNIGDYAVTLAASILPGMVTGMPLNFLSKALLPSASNIIGINQLARGAGLGAILGAAGQAGVRTAISGTVEAAALEAANIPMQEALGRDWQLADSAANIASAPVFGAVLGFADSAIRSGGNVGKYKHFKTNAKAYEDLTGVPPEQSGLLQQLTDPSLVTVNSIRKNFRDALGRLSEGVSVPEDEFILQKGFEQFHGEMSNRVSEGDYSAGEAQRSMENLTYNVLETQARKVFSLSQDQASLKKLYKDIFNREIKFFYTGDTPTAQKLYGRVYSGRPGVIYIAHNLTGNIMTEVAGHEMWHSIEYGNPRLAKQVVEAIDSFYTPQQINARMEATGRSQSAIWRGLGQDKKVKEMAADTFSDAMTRKEFWVHLKNQDPEAFKSLAGFVKSIIARADKARETSVGVDQGAARDFSDAVGGVVAAARAAGEFDKVPEQHIIWKSPPEIRGDKKAIAGFFKERNTRLYKDLIDTLEKFKKERDNFEKRIGADDLEDQVNEDRLVATVSQRTAPQYLLKMATREPLLTQQKGFSAILNRLENWLESGGGRNNKEAYKALDDLVSLTKAIQQQAKDSINYKSQRLVALKDPQGKVSFYRLVDSELSRNSEPADWADVPDPIEVFSEKHLGASDDIVFEAAEREFESTEATEATSKAAGVAQGEIVPQVSLKEMGDFSELIDTVDNFLKQHPDLEPQDRLFLQSLFTKERLLNSEERALIKKAAGKDVKTPVVKLLKKIIGKENFDRFQMIVEDSVKRDLSYDITPSRQQVDAARLKGWKEEKVPSEAWNYRSPRYQPELVWDKSKRQYDNIYHPSELLTQATKQSVLEEGYGALYTALAKELERLDSVKKFSEATPDQLPKRRNEIYNIGNRIARLTRVLTDITDEKILEIMGFESQARQDMLDKALLSRAPGDVEQIGLDDNGRLIEGMGQYDDMPAPEPPDGSVEGTLRKGISKAQEILTGAAKGIGDFFGPDNKPIDPARKALFTRVEEFTKLVQSMADQAKAATNLGVELKGEDYDKAKVLALSDLFKKDSNYAKAFFGAGFDPVTDGFSLGPAVSEEMSSARGQVGGQIQNILSKHARLDEFKKGKMPERFEAELYDYIGYNKPSDDLLVMELGDFVKTYYDLFRSSAAKRGVDIPEAYGYVMPWDYGREKVLALDKSSWVQRTLDSLNQEATLSVLKKNGLEGPLDKFLGAMYEDIQNRRGKYVSNPDDPILIDTEIGSNHRLLIFHPDTAYNYFKEFSSHGSTFTGVVTNMLRRSEMMVALEAFGSNPSKNMVSAIEAAGLNPSSGKGGEIMNLYNEVMGINDTPVNRTLSETGKWVRTVANTAVLAPGAITAAGTDAASAPSVIRAIGGHAVPKEINFFSAVKQSVSLEDSHPLKQYVASLGAGVDNILATLMARTRRQKYESWFFNMNGMNSETVHAESAYTISWGRVQAELIDNPALIDEGMSHFHQRYGLNKSDFDAARDAVVSIEAAKGNKIKVLDPFKIQEPSVRRKWMAFLQDTRAMAILRPTAVDKAFWKFGSRAGTPAGEAARTAFQYMHWTNAAKSRALDRFRFALGGKGFRNMVKTGQFSKGILPLGQYAAAAFFAGWVSLNIKEMLAGREPITFLSGDQRTAANIGRIASNTTFGALSNILSGGSPVEGIFGPAITKPLKILGSDNMSELTYNFSHSLPFVNSVDALDNVNNLILGTLFGEQYQSTVNGIEDTYKTRLGQDQLGL